MPTGLFPFVASLNSGNAVIFLRTERLRSSSDTAVPLDDCAVESLATCGEVEHHGSASGHGVGANGGQVNSLDTRRT